ncbi:MAG: adenylate/guanylate cyclase domain-containing protein [Deltaproteobacteria bacterium]|jgi:adenylate cyclase|nr:adenylate/guanylate cyclase domain-containing protein [Deltaproteobacteria bacterium]
MPDRLLQWLARLAVALCAPAAVALLSIWQPFLVRQVENRIYDTLLRAVSPGQPSPLPVIVDIDERSLDRLGQFPWPRYHIARLIDAINRDKPAAVALDLLFTAPDRTSLGRLEADLATTFGVSASLAGVPEHLRDNDPLLAGALSRAPSVLAGFMVFDESPGKNDATKVRRFSPVVAREKGAPELDAVLPAARAMQSPVPVLAGAGRTGFINISMGRDGIWRHTPLFVRLDGRIYANFGLEASLLALNVRSPVLKIGPNGVRELVLGEHGSIPLQEGGLLPLFFRGPQRMYPYVSAVDVLDGTCAPGIFAGKVVFVGTSAAGLRDQRATPFDVVYPGIEGHAVLADMILSKRYLHFPEDTRQVQLMAIFCVGLLAALLFLRLPPLLFLGAGLAAGAGIAYGCWCFLEYRHLYVSPLYMLATLVLSSLGIALFKFWFEEAQKRHIRGAFSRYVAPEVVDKIVRNPAALGLSGEERVLTILFTDLVGFTSASEKMAPETVVAVLNRYFTPMAAIVHAHLGTFDKFIGDAIMAFWNAPLDVPDHAAQGVATALDMREALASLNQRLDREFGLTLRMGLGLHTGLARVGNMGSATLMDYTVIGDNVNLASRLEGLTRHYGLFGLTTQATAQAAAGPFIFFPVDTVRVKGKQEVVELFSMLPEEEAAACAEDLARWREALAAYRQGCFAASLALLRLLKNPLFAGLAAEFSCRCEAFIREPPENFTAVYEPSGK